MSHTPAPWEARQRANGRWVVGATAPLGGRGTTGKVSALWDVANGVPQHDNTAADNARLVAAAPELLAMLKLCAGFFSGGEPCAVCSEWPHRLDCALQSTIAKAEGR